jgi:hypothetical protein
LIWVFGFLDGGKCAGREALRLLKRPARLLRCLVAQGRVRPDDVVVVAPEGQLSPCVVQSAEDFLVQQFIPEAAVEAFDERVLLRLTRVDVVPRHLVLIGLFQERPTGELCAVIADNAAGFAEDPDQGTEFPGDPRTRQAGVCHEA